jgi:hypothetical protein
VVGERVEEGLDTVGKRFGAHRVEKLIGVWSSMAARSGNWEPSTVALRGGGGLGSKLAGLWSISTMVWSSRRCWLDMRRARGGCHR